MEEDAQPEGEVHLLQVLRHTGCRLVAHMVTSWLQADYRLVTGRWQRGGRARGQDAGREARGARREA